MTDRTTNDPGSGVPRLRMAGVGTSGEGLPAPHLVLAGIGSSGEGLPAPVLVVSGNVVRPHPLVRA